MKKSILVLVFTMMVFGCSNKSNSDGESGKRIDFKGTMDVYLDQDINQSKPELSVLRIRKKNKDGEVLYTFDTKTNFSKAVKLGNYIYVSAYDSAKSDGNFTLWKIDLVKGTVLDTGIRLFDDFEFSEDGLWICYVFNDHVIELSSYPGLKSYFPVVFLEKLGGFEKYKYDMILEMKNRADFSEIKNEDNSFIVEYYQDSPKPLRIGKIDVSTHKFEWLK